MQSLKSKLDSAIDDEKALAISKIESIEENLSQYNGYTGLSEERRSTVKTAFDVARQRVNEQSLIAMIRDSANDFENHQYSALLQQIEDWNTPVVSVPPVNPDDDDNQPADPPPPSPPKVEIVGARELSVSFNKPLLESEADIDAYLEGYRKALLSTVQQGKKVRV
jgi:hypothetical protein